MLYEVNIKWLEFVLVEIMHRYGLLDCIIINV